MSSDFYDVDPPDGRHMTSDERFERSDSLGHLVNWASRLFVRGLDRRIRPLGISAGQLPVLLALADAHSLSQKELVNQSVIEQPTMAATLVRMQKTGLVARSGDPNDGRGSRFELTNESRAALIDLYAALNEGNAKALSGFSDVEVSDFKNFMRRVVDNLRVGFDR